MKPSDTSRTDLRPYPACIVQSADCLPVLLAASDGRAVGAAHAGWRGLAGGVVEAAIAAVSAAAQCAPDEICAWLGACASTGAAVANIAATTNDPASFVARVNVLNI